MAENPTEEEVKALVESMGVYASLFNSDPTVAHVHIYWQDQGFRASDPPYPPVVIPWSVWGIKREVRLV